jgi:hypothetical protein
MFICDNQVLPYFISGNPYFLQLGTTIMALLAVYDHGAVAAALDEALRLGTPASASVKALLKEDLKVPVAQFFPARPEVPAVLKRPLAVYGAGYAGGAA